MSCYANIPAAIASDFPYSTFQLSNDGNLIINGSSAAAQLNPRDEKLFRALAEETSIELQISIADSFGASFDINTGFVASSTISVPLSIIVYGPMEIYDDIGDFFQDCDLYLQDPIECDRDVPYRNPHRLSGRDRDVPMTSVFGREVVDVLSEQPDNFETLFTSIDLPEMDTPQMLETSLLQ
jgi:SWI/SNF-related matrix-associated actin-dependent regulator of chromatin subfamily A3